MISTQALKAGDGGPAAVAFRAAGMALGVDARGWAAVTMSDDLAVSSAGFAKAVRDLRYAGLVRETTRKGRYAANPQ